MITGVRAGKSRRAGTSFFTCSGAVKWVANHQPAQGIAFSPQAGAGSCKNYLRKIWQIGEAILIFATHSNGTMAERLGIGLQNRVHRFESGWYL